MDDVGLCAQQKVYAIPLDTPAVAVERAYTSYGELFVTICGILKPVREATTSSPQELVEGIARIAFVAAKPPIVPISCI
jgi:hypothetical protein